jgi:formylglycine-generating enzyme required for sulfatase activity
LAVAAASIYGVMRSLETPAVPPSLPARALPQLSLEQGLASLRSQDFERAVAQLTEAAAAPNVPPEVAGALERARAARKATANGMVRVGDYWIDRYEYPNVAGELPRASVDYAEAARLCTAAGKRLCTEGEWERACEGGRKLAFPYGVSYDAAACVTGRKAAAPIGAAPRCVSEAGVWDLSGNLAEWTASPVQPGAAQRIVRGGSWRQSGGRVGCAERDYVLPGLGGMPWVGFRCCFAVGDASR